MERVYLKLSHYHTEYTAIRCRLVVLCCDAVLYFLEREALQWKEIKIRKCTVIELFNLQNKDWEIQHYEVLDYCGSTAQRTVANEGTTHLGGSILTVVFFKHQERK